jgi:CRP/FNR family transcriptional regulator
MSGFSEISSGCQECRLKSKAVMALDENELLFLEKGCRNVSLKTGEALFREGLPYSHIIFLKKGFVKVHMIGPTGKDQILKITKPGAYIGIQTILGGEINHYSATTLTNVSTCFIKVEIFKELIKLSGKFSFEILKYICEEELNYYRRFVDQQQKQMNGRLADALLYLCDDIFLSRQFTMPFSNTDLAALIGSTREGVNRTLSNFKSHGIIRIRNKEIEIIDYDKLKNISEKG